MCLLSGNDAHSATAAAAAACQSEWDTVWFSVDVLAATCCDNQLCSIYRKYAEPDLMCDLMFKPFSTSFVMMTAFFLRLIIIKAIVIQLVTVESC